MNRKVGIHGLLLHGSLLSFLVVSLSFSKEVTAFTGEGVRTPRHVAAAHAKEAVGKPSVSSNWIPSRKGSFDESQTSPLTQSTENYTYTFEVLRAIEPPAGAKMCELEIMTNHLFANLPPPFEGSYTPPEDCGEEWSLVVLTWSANVIGRQYDRLGDVFFDGLHILHTTTEEPSAQGVKWSFEADVTRFAPFLKQERYVTVYVGNVVDSTYTGIYNVSLKLAFYGGPSPPQFADSIVPIGAAERGYAAWALDYEASSGSKEISALPRNIYRAELEITQCQSANDEFYWSNVPWKYIDEVRPEYKDSFLGGGVFRETQAYLDGVLMGSVWQYPVIFTGGVNPYWWRPVVGIGAFATPTYVLDITPFVGRLVDGKNHTFTLAVDNILEGGTWFVDAILHLWLDKGCDQTTGELLTYQVASSVTPSELVSFYANGVDANITTKAMRLNAVSGSVGTSFGNFTSTVESAFSLLNLNRVLSDTFVGVTAQEIKTSTYSVMQGENGTVFYSHTERFSFPFYVYVQYSIYNGNVFC